VISSSQTTNGSIKTRYRTRTTNEEEKSKYIENNGKIIEKNDVSIKEDEKANHNNENQSQKVEVKISLNKLIANGTIASLKNLNSSGRKRKRTSNIRPIILYVTDDKEEEDDKIDIKILTPNNKIINNQDNATIDDNIIDEQISQNNLSKKIAPTGNSNIRNKHTDQNNKSKRKIEEKIKVERSTTTHREGRRKRKPPEFYHDL